MQVLTGSVLKSTHSAKGSERIWRPAEGAASGDAAKLRGLGRVSERLGASVSPSVQWVSRGF